MLRSLFDALRARLGPAHPQVMVRLQQIDVWLESLPLAEARGQALALIANPDWFVTEPPTGVGTIAPQAPATVRDLDVPGDEAREGSVPSVYHALLRVGAFLDYVAPPPATA